MSLCFSSAAEQARRFSAGEVSARELASAYLDRIAAADERLGAYLHVDAEGALARADELDAARARGDTLGPLAGVPVALKDALVTEGVPTTAGSKMLAGWRPPYDGDAAARLRAAGAVVLGKLNMDEFAMGSSTEHSAFRTCRNPWDPERVPGGSSGGSAVAVAAGLCAASLGTDTGGSIRQPAAHCGVVGVKPTYGRVSRYGVVAFASSLDQVGPFGRTVEDCALLLEVIAGLDPRDATSLDAPVPRYRDALAGGAKGLRVGIADELGADRADPEVRAAFEAAVATLTELGATTHRVSLPHTRYALPAYYLVAPAEASSNLARYDGVRYGHRAASAASLEALYADSRHEGFGTEVVRRIMLGTFALRAGYYDAYYKKAQQARALIRRDFERAFEEVDVIVSPAAPSPAFRFGEKSEPIDMYLADVFNLSASLAGIPGASVPCGFSQGGLPIGLQLLGRPLGEETLLRAAAAYERATDWSARRPPEVA